jgi:hypothetical protein
MSVVHPPPTPACTKKIKHCCVTSTASATDFNIYNKLLLCIKKLETTASLEETERTLSLGVKWLGHEADHSPPSSAEVKNVVLYLHSPVHLHGMVLS